MKFLTNIALVSGFVLAAISLTYSYDLGDGIDLEWKLIDYNIEFTVSYQSSGWIGLAFNDDDDFDNDLSEYEVVICGVKNEASTTTIETSQSTVTPTSPTTLSSLAPTSESTTSAPEEESTTSSPEEESTTSSPEEESTTSSPEEESTTSSQDEESTTSSPEEESTTSSQDEESTTSSPEEESTTLVSTSESTTVAVQSNSTQLNDREYLKVFKNGFIDITPFWVISDGFGDDSTTRLKLTRLIKTSRDDDVEFDERFIYIRTALGSTDDTPTEIRPIPWSGIKRVDLFTGSNAVPTSGTKLNVMIMISLALICTFKV